MLQSVYDMVRQFLNPCMLTSVKREGRAIHAISYTTCYALSMLRASSFAAPLPGRPRAAAAALHLHLRVSAH